MGFPLPSGGGGGGAVTSVFSRTGAVVKQAGDYTAADVTNAADKSSGSSQAFTGSVQAPALVPAGLTGATAASRFVGATASGAPASGTFVVGDFVVDQTGKVWICTTGGTPGTWTQAGPVTSVFARSGAVTAQSGDYTAAQVTNAADKSSGSTQTFTGNLQAPAVIASGLSGATAASRYAGATASGAPASGTFAVGDLVVDQTGKLWVCTVAGTPGTWAQIGSAPSAQDPDYTYLIYKTGANFAAKASLFSGLADVAANADAAAVFSSCLTNMGAVPRGTILFAGNTTFTWNTTPALPRTYSGPFTRSGTLTNTSTDVTGLSTTSDLRPGMSVSGTGIPANTLIEYVLSSTSIRLTLAATTNGAQTLSFYNGPDDEKWLIVRGGGATVLQLGSASQFFTFNRVADYDGFCGYAFQDLELDCNNVAGTGGNHVFFGTLTGGSGTLQRVDFRRIYTDNVVVRNVPVAGVGGAHRAGVWLEVSHVNAGGATTPEAIRNYITDIAFRRYRQLGGNTGILVAGFVPNHADYKAVNIFGDRWLAEDIFVDPLTRDQTALDPGSGIQFGGQACGETMVVQRLESHNIGDDNEFNNFRQIIVRDCHAYDHGQASFFACNFGYVNGLDATEQKTQRILFENCHNHTTNQRATNAGAKPSYGFALNTVGNADMGTVTYRRCTATHRVKQLDVATAFPFFIGSGTSYTIDHLICDGFKYTSWYDASGTATTDLQGFFFYNGPQRVTLRDIEAIWKGDRKQASGFVCWVRGLYLNSPDMRLEIDGYRFTDQTVNAGSVGWTMPVTLAKDASSGTNKINFTIRGLYHTASPGDTFPYGVYAYTAGSIVKGMVSDLDGSRLVNYTPYSGDAGNAAAVTVRDIKMPSLAVPEVAFTPGASTVAAQYVGGWSGLMTVTGGTVTAISVSTDNVTYRQVAAGTNTSFFVDNGMWIKMTYTVVPSCNLIPAR